MPMKVSLRGDWMPTLNVDGVAGPAYSELPDGRRRHSDTAWCLGMLMMVAGIPAITAESFDEVWAKVHFYESLNHAVRMNAETQEPIPFTREDIESFIGATFAAQHETFDHFAARMVDSWALDNGLKYDRDPLHWLNGDGDRDVLLCAAIRQLLSVGAIKQSTIDALSDREDGNELLDDWYETILAPAFTHLERRMRHL